MGCGCCLEGSTREETYTNTLEWMAGWAHGMANVLLGVQKCLDRNSNGGAFNGSYEDCSKDELISLIEAQKIVMSGIADTIRCKYRDDANRSVLCSLKKSFSDIKDMAQGKLPTRTRSWGSPIVDRDSLPPCENWVVVNIKQSRDFFFKHTAHECSEFLFDAIEEECPRKEGYKIEGVQLVFEDKDCVDALARKSMSLNSGDSLSVIEAIVAKYNKPDCGLLIAWRSKAAEYLYASDSTSVEALHTHKKNWSPQEECAAPAPIK